MLLDTYKEFYYTRELEKTRKKMKRKIKQLKQNKNLTVLFI